MPEYDVPAGRGDFEPLISEQLFYRAQAVLSGRVPRTTPLPLQPKWRFANARPEPFKT